MSDADKLRSPRQRSRNLAFTLHENERSRTRQGCSHCERKRRQCYQKKRRPSASKHSLCDSLKRNLKGQIYDQSGIQNDALLSISYRKHLANTFCRSEKGCITLSARAAQRQEGNFRRTIHPDRNSHSAQARIGVKREPANFVQTPHIFLGQVR